MEMLQVEMGYMPEPKRRQCSHRTQATVCGQPQKSALKRWAHNLASLRCWALPLIACLMMTGCDSSLVIVNDLDEREANEMLVLLNLHSVYAEKQQNVSGSGGAKVVTWNLAVPTSKRFEALGILNTSGLPRRRGQTLLSLFSKQGLVSSEMEEQVRYQAGLADQIANTIRKIDGVLDADVQLSIPQEETIPGQTKVKPVTASVYLKHNGVLDDPNAQLEIKVKRLVSGSIPGLSFDNVTLVGDRVPDREGAINMSTPPEELLTRIWGVRIARGSTRAFRFLFGFLIALIALIVVPLLWLIWKLQEILTSEKGLKSLFDASPLQLTPRDSTPKTAPDGGDALNAPATAPPPPTSGPIGAPGSTSTAAGIRAAPTPPTSRGDR